MGGGDHFRPRIAGHVHQRGEIAADQSREEQEQAAELGGKPAGLQGELAAVGDGGGGGAGEVGALLVLAARQTGEARLVQDLPDGRGAERSAFIFERALDVVERKILLAHGEDRA